MISFRRFAAADCRLLSEIGGTALMESHGHSAPVHVVQAHIDEAFSEETCRAELLLTENIFHAIYYNNEPAGYSKISFDYPHPAVHLQQVSKMKQIYLLKKFYDLKLGHQLMQHAIDLSKSHGNQGMWLNVWKEKERAMRFYEKQGFRIVGETLFVLTPEHSNPNWVMLLQY